jgi:hypothetical protein
MYNKALYINLLYSNSTLHTQNAAECISLSFLSYYSKFSLLLCSECHIALFSDTFLLWVIPIGWLVGWLVGWWVGWLVNRLVGWSILWLVGQSSGLLRKKRGQGGNGAPI